MKSFAKLRRGARTHRRLLIALLAGAAVWFALGALRPPSPPTVPTLVAVRALAGGVVVSEADVAVRDLPAEAVPAERLTSPDEAIGRPLTIGVPAGATLLPASVVSKSGLAGPGLVVLPITLRSTAAGLVEVGDRIDLLGTDDEGGAPRLATGVRVVAVITTDSDSSPLSPANSAGPLVLVELPPSQVASVAGAAARGPIGFGLR